MNKGKVSMETANIKDMVKGWFIGNFEPSLLKTNDVEVSVKNYNKGESEERHYHNIASEFTVVILGKVSMNGRVFQAGDIIKVAPLESTDFVALEDSTTVVVKLPGANNDKFAGNAT